MTSDIVRPDGNEKELCEMAIQLGFTKIWFAYPLTKAKGMFLPKTKIPSDIMVLARTTKELEKARDQNVIYQGSDDIRKAIEIGPSIICDIETSSRKDFIHHRNSGLNQVTAKIALEKKVTFGIPFLTLLESTSRHIIMGRLQQNIRFFRKYGLKTRIFSFAREPFQMRSPAELKSIMTDLGMHDSGKALK